MGVLRTPKTENERTILIQFPSTDEREKEREGGRGGESEELRSVHIRRPTIPSE